MLLIGALPYFMLKSGSLDLGYYGNHLLYQFFWLNVVLLAFNMLPTFPLDGGRILRACLALRMDASRATLIAATVGKIASVVLIFAGIIGYGEFWLIWIAIGVSNFFTCQQELMMAREDSPYAEPSWAYGGGFTPSDDSYLNSDREERPGPIRRFLESRSERQQARVAAEEEEMKQRVDDLLGKVSQVGMDGLTEEERSFLQEASDRYKKT